MAEENIVRRSVTYDVTPQEWEDAIIEAPHDAPRKSVWIPMDHKTGHWYLSRERPIHNLVNSVLREYMEAEIARRQAESDGEKE